MPVSALPGMGARQCDGGVSFRVWAPNARGIAVVGDFNGWSATADALTSEDNGYWSGDVAGARIGQQYKYLIQNGDASFWKNDPYAFEMTQSNGNAIIPDPSFDWGTDVFQMPSWNDMVIYEIHIGTFHSEPNTGKGTFESAMQKLPYLQDLGINVVEIMASDEFPTDSSWGYNPSQIFAVESSYGGFRGLNTFVKAAHAHGIAVVYDVVYNHLGPGDLDLWQFDGWQIDGKGGIYFYQDWRAATPWGDTRPDYGRSEVRQYLLDNALMWLEQRHLDGLRWDATNYIRNVHGSDADRAADLPEGWTLIQQINDAIDVSQSWKISIAEDMQGNSAITTPTAAGGAGFDAQWDEAFLGAVRGALVDQNDASRDIQGVAVALDHRLDGSAWSRVIYTESHDANANGHARLPEEIWPGNAGSWQARKRSALGAVLTLTAPGIPMLFQGQEFLEDRYFSDMIPLDWNKAESYSGIRQLYCDLIRLRRNQSGTTGGLCGEHIVVHHVDSATKVIAYHRWSAGGSGDDVVVVVNFSEQSYPSYSIGFPSSGIWKVRFNSDWTGYGPDFGGELSYDTEATGEGRDDMPYNGNVGLGPYGAIILSQDRS